MSRALLVCVVLVAACKKPSSDTEWGDDPRALGACIGTARAGAAVPGGIPTICFEKQSETECTASTERMNYLYMEHTTCASRGYSKRCQGFDASARLQECPIAGSAAVATEVSAAALDAAKQVMAIYDAATAAADETAGDCIAFAAKLDPLRDQLLAIGAAHPRVLRTLSTEQLQGLEAIKKQEAISTKLPACKASPSTKDFARAMTKVM